MKNNKPLIAITGASSGIGLECAKLFSQKGFPVLLMARRLEILQSLNLPNSICSKVDVRNFDELSKAIKDAEIDFGPVELLINNAGIMPIDWYLKQDRQEKMDMIDINLKGIINGMDAVLPKMVENHLGTIINVGSVAGRWTSDWRAVYNASKFGVHAVSEAVRREVSGSGVRISIIAPAIVDSNLLDTSKNPELVLQYKNIKKEINNGLTSAEIADQIYYMYQLPQHVCIKELVISHVNQKI
ncbi:oxidoreductase [Spiroplasma sabaudiense Ar-1343]|uniref:NADP-dependent 3-hydroxy acid dehydrogenase YdfG n=1 Tax=Spiroplasma sabaudiense Ar-1343 TaxID=1276257 RepID=W6AAM5_9MOLU|nr:SDR family oxidoreductase [Spiroplasma sabaudiense]AHI53905.1 oxidoreductase [Spiroplasma sabaudiense Ar-1343]